MLDVTKAKSRASTMLTRFFVLSINSSLPKHKRLGEHGINSVCTLSEDVTLDPGPRTQKIKASGAKRGLSHHLNAGGGVGAEFIHSIHTRFIFNAFMTADCPHDTLIHSMTVFLVFDFLRVCAVYKIIFHDGHGHCTSIPMHEIVVTSFCFFGRSAEDTANWITRFFKFIFEHMFKLPITKPEPKSRNQ